MRPRVFSVQGTFVGWVAQSDDLESAYMEIEVISCNRAVRDAVIGDDGDLLHVEIDDQTRYHVLGGALDPLGGIGPNELNIRTLLQRIGGVLADVPAPPGFGPGDDSPSGVIDADGNVPPPEITEVIIATDPNTEGEATSTYLARLLRDFPGLAVTRLASGMPLGGDLEYVDELTLSRALTGRLAI